VRYTNASTSIGDGEKFALVTGVKSVQNKAGATVAQVTVVVDGTAPQTFLTEDAEILKGVSAFYSGSVKKYDADVGDVIKYSLNAANEIALVKIGFDAKTGDFAASGNPFGESGGYNASNRLYYGNVYAKKGFSLAFTPKNPTDGAVDPATDLELTDTSRASVYLYDAKTDKVYESGLSEVYAYSAANGEASRILAFTNNATMRMLVIYK
jgi:hypothetical protein